ncbi:uncharacterized protein LOC110383147 isoform X2 [Helicoverpa armigera]|uniref:uncharacterized protein LOC110383147 isoform X2 n=1 Tax=Helicoverpa armigera TaxID=29058 RepID=UPI00308292FE
MSSRCILCGPPEDSSITLHRFPKPGITNALRCELWAKYCFPNQAGSSSPQFQMELFNKQKMLCNKHFEEKVFNQNRLLRSAVPTVPVLQMARTPFCICCLKRDTAYVSLTGCKHAQFIKRHPIKKINEDNLICYECHNILKKIKEFRLRVDESYKILYPHATVPESSYRKPNLQVYKIPDVIISNDYENIDTNIKVEMDSAENSTVENMDTDYIEEEIPTVENKNIYHEELVENFDHNYADCLEENATAENSTVETLENKGTNYVEQENLDHNYTNSLVAEIAAAENSTVENFKRYHTSIKVETVSPEECTIENSTIDISSANNSESNLIEDTKKRTKLKNIESAFKIIKSNQNDACMSFLAASLQNISKTLLKDNLNISTQNITSFINLRKISENTSKLTLDGVQNKLLDNKKDILKKSLTKKCTNNYKMRKHKLLELRISSKIKKTKITREELLEERSRTAVSQAYANSLYRCDNCLLGFYYEENFKDHMKRKHSPKQDTMRCDVCLQSLNPGSGYEEHVSRHFTRFDCLVCNRRFSSFEVALSHYKTKHCKSKFFKCKHCPYISRVKDNLRHHFRSHRVGKITSMKS